MGCAKSLHINAETDAGGYKSLCKSVDDRSGCSERSAVCGGMHGRTHGRSAHGCSAQVQRMPQYARLHTLPRPARARYTRTCNKEGTTAGLHPPAHARCHGMRHGHARMQAHTHMLMGYKPIALFFLSFFTLRCVKNQNPARYMPPCRRNAQIRTGGFSGLIYLCLPYSHPTRSKN